MFFFVNFFKYFFRKIFYRNFAKHFSYFAKFCRRITLANEISRNFVRFLVLRKKFHEISSKTYFAKWFCWNFAKYFSYFAKFRRITSFAKWNFSKFLPIFLYEISWNFAKFLHKFWEITNQKFREISIREIFLATLLDVPPLLRTVVGLYTTFLWIYKALVHVRSVNVQLDNIDS